MSSCNHEQRYLYEQSPGLPEQFWKEPHMLPLCHRRVGGPDLSEILLLFHRVLLSADENLTSYLESFRGGMLLRIWCLLKFLPQVNILIFLLIIP